MAEEHMLRCELLTPEGQAFDGELFQVSCKTVIGEVGIRARHAPMLARLVPSEIRLHHSDGGEVERFAGAEGWLEVFANRVEILVGEAIPPDQLDTEDLRAKLDDAEKRLSDAEEDSAAYEAAELDKARAEAFLAIAEG